MARTSLQRSGEGVCVCGGDKQEDLEGVVTALPGLKAARGRHFKPSQGLAFLIPSLPQDILQALTQPSAPVPGRREAGSG